MSDQTRLIPARVYLAPQHKEICQAYGRKYNILATAGTKAGQVHVSEVIRLAIEQLGTKHGIVVNEDGPLL